MKFWLLLCSQCLTSAVHATHGYWFSGYGTRSAGMGGIGVAYPQDSIVAALNPAGMALIGRRYDVGVTLFNPNRGYSYTGSEQIPGESFRSGQQIFLIPHLGINWVSCGGGSFGISVYGNGGLNTNYGQNNPVFGQDKLSVDYVQQIFAPTFAYSLCCGRMRHACGVSFLGAVQRIKLRGLQNFAAFSQDPINVSNKGYDVATGYSWRLGYMASFCDKISAGFSWSPKFDMQTFRRYAGIFARQGKLDIPATWIAGVTVHPWERFHAAFDLQRIYYAKVTALGNPVQFIFDPETPLGSDNGPGFGWKNMWVYKLGADYCLSRSLVVRAGFATNSGTYAPSQVDPNIIAPAVVRAHITLGATWICRGHQFDIAYGYHVHDKIRGESTFGLGEITEQMNQNFLEINYGHCF